MLATHTLISPFISQTCGRWCDDEFDGPIMLGDAVQHAQFENAMLSLVRASTCVDFEAVTSIKIVDQALVKYDLPVRKATSTVEAK